MSDVIEIGRHRLLCGDVMAGDVQRVLGRELVDVVYSDPPWGPGNLKYWGTHAKRKQSGDWRKFLDAFCVSVTRASPAGVIFVEMGLRWVDELAAIMRACGRAEAARWTVQYKAGNELLPNALWYSGPSLPAGFNPTPLRGAALPRYCIAPFARPEGIVLDPCCGKGYTARAAVAHGMAFYGLEYNASRLAVSRAWLEKHA